MFKKTLLVLLVALSVFSCQKNVDETAALQEVSFSAIELTPDIGLKSTDSTIVCKNDVPDYAAALISVGGADTWYYPALFTLDGKIYTQSIKLPVGTYTVKEFFLYKNEGGTTGYEAGDIIVFATPNSTGQYKEYVTNPTTFTFAVEAFKKAQVDIEVLCFQDHLFTDFGFNWFAVTEIVVRQFCFFGDICITDANAAAFAGSIYATGGLNPDEEAVFRVIVKNNGVETPYSPFSNEAIYNTGKALCVDYPDNLSEVNNFTFELQIWVPSTVPGTFVWQTYTTFTSTDAGNLFYGNVDLGNNTIVKSFAVGTCSPDSNPIFTWLAPIAPMPQTIIVHEVDLAHDNNDLISNPTKWCYYNDASDINPPHDDMGIFPPDANNKFVTGPGTAPSGSGSAQIWVEQGTYVSPDTKYNPQIALATYQFSGIPLANITTMKYSTNDPNLSLPGISINFNVSLDGNDVWANNKRLHYSPKYTNPSGEIPNVWQEWDALSGLWAWSNFAGYGGSATQWPDGSTVALRTWNDIVSSFPNAKFRVTDSFFGFRVDDDNSSNNTQYVDKFIFGVNGINTTYNFEP